MVVRYFPKFFNTVGLEHFIIDMYLSAGATLSIYGI